MLLALFVVDITRPDVLVVDGTRRMGQAELHRLRKLAYVSEKKLSAEVATRIHLEETWVMLPAECCRGKNGGEAN